MNTPAALLDMLIGILGAKNDAGLSKALGTHAPSVSRIRRDKLDISSAFILLVHEVSGVPVQKIREVAGLPKFVKPTR